MDIAIQGSPVYLLRDADIWVRMIADAGGQPFARIYRLHRLDGSSHPVHMPRLLDVDPRGILYLGTSFHVPNRVGLVKRAVSAAYKVLSPDAYQHLPYTNPHVHPTGKKLIRVGKRFVDLIPFDELGITVVRYVAAKSLQEGETDYGHFDQEEGLLREYEAVFGERPALNG